MPNLNGSLIVETLLNLEEPATMKEIVSLIALTAKVPENEIKPEIIATLHYGARYGFLQRHRGRYRTEPLNEGAIDAIKKSAPIQIEARASKRNPLTSSTASRPLTRQRSRELNADLRND